MSEKMVESIDQTQGPMVLMESIWEVCWDTLVPEGNRGMGGMLKDTLIILCSVEYKKC